MADDRCRMADGKCRMGDDKCRDETGYPRSPGARKWVAPSPHAGQNLVGSHGGRRHPHDQGKAWSSVRDVEREWESLS